MFGIVCAIVFGLIGMMIFSSAKKNANFTRMAIAAGLMVYPYLISNNIALVVIGVGLCYLAWLVRD